MRFPVSPALAAQSPVVATLVSSTRTSLALVSLAPSAHYLTAAATELVSGALARFAVVFANA